MAEQSKKTVKGRSGIICSFAIIPEKKYMNKRRFYYEARIKITRKEAREHLEQFHLACEL